MQQGSGSEGSSADVGDRLSALLNEVEIRLEEGFADEALVLAQQAFRLLERHSNIPDDLSIDTNYLLASCYFEQRDILAALRQYERVRASDSKDPELDYWQARALFHVWRFDEANAMLTGFEPNNHTRAGSLYYRALTFDFMGASPRAESLFVRAEQEDPTEFPKPLRLAPEEVQEMLQELVQGLPKDVRRAIEHVRIELNQLPDPRIHASPQLDPLVLGLCKRRGEQCRGPSGIAFEHDGIEVFQRNMERVCTDRDEFFEELRVTILNEIGHHLDGKRGHSLRHEPLN